jgi:hypothetical protein
LKRRNNISGRQQNAAALGGNGSDIEIKEVNLHCTTLPKYY